MLLHVISGAFIISFSAKGNLFNDLFQIQYTPFQNNSSLLSFAFKTDKHMATSNVTDESICNIIKSPNPNKSYCWGGISIKFI